MSGALQKALTEAKAVLFDFDCTLVDTKPVEPLRRPGKWTEILQEENIEKCKVYDGIPEMLQKLKASGKKIGIVTNSPKYICEEILKVKGLFQYIDYIAGYRETQKHKPDPEPVTHTLEKLGVVDAKNVLVIGDRVQDIQAGKAAGCQTVGALWDSSEIEALKESTPTFLANKVSDLMHKEKQMSGVSKKPISKSDSESDDEDKTEEARRKSKDIAGKNSETKKSDKASKSLPPKKPAGSSKHEKEKKGGQQGIDYSVLNKSLGGSASPSPDPMETSPRSPKSPSAMSESDPFESAVPEGEAKQIPIFRDKDLDIMQKIENDFLGLTWYLKGYWKGRSGDTPITIQDDWSKVFIDANVKEVTTNTALILKFISAILTKIIHSDKDVAIVAVPSSNKDKKDTAVVRLAKALVAENKNTDASDVLMRVKTIKSSRMSKNFQERAGADHDGSIEIQHPEKIKDKSVLLLDDVITNGGTFRSCKKKLEAAGAKRVCCLAVARTIQNPFYESPFFSATEDLLREKLPAVLSEIGQDVSYGTTSPKKSAKQAIAENFSHAETLHQDSGYQSSFFKSSRGLGEEEEVGGTALTTSSSSSSSISSSPSSSNSSSSR